MYCTPLQAGGWREQEVRKANGADQQKIVPLLTMHVETLADNPGPALKNP